MASSCLWPCSMADPGVAGPGEEGAPRPGRLETRPSSGHLASLDVSSLVYNIIHPSEGLTLHPEFTAAQFIQEIVIVVRTLVPGTVLSSDY